MHACNIHTYTRATNRHKAHFKFEDRKQTEYLNEIQIATIFFFFSRGFVKLFWSIRGKKPPAKLVRK